MPQLGGPQPVDVSVMSLEEQFAYYMAILNEQDNHSANEVMNEIADLCAEEFEVMLDAAMKASGFRSPPPLERLIWYRTKPEELWEEQLLKFPRDFEEDWRDFQNLRQRALRGDFGPEQQAEEVAWSAQAEIGGLDEAAV